MRKPGHAFFFPRRIFAKQKGEGFLARVKTSISVRSRGHSTPMEEIELGGPTAEGLENSCSQLHCGITDRLAALLHMDIQTERETVMDIASWLHGDSMDPDFLLSILMDLHYSGEEGECFQEALSFYDQFFDSIPILGSMG
ncbi:hypothetical protein Scep_019632 [Stephania cephalantha]|uniref:Uncharacterized protein n=1 Tax=Stephania cephalantha TaxID=152367 RepID=A0AAP0IBJ7_9MAGN